MKISQYIDQLEGWGSDDRERYLRPLLAVLSPVSIATLRQVERIHFAKAEADYPAFVKAQNSELLKCLQAEVADIGVTVTVRAELGLSPLTLDTEIEIEATASA